MNEKMKKHAIDYFNGTITSTAERELYQFVKANADNILLFRKWEQEWKQQHVPSFNELTSLKLLKAKIRKQEYVGLIRRLSIRFSAAAAVLVLVSTLITWRLMQPVSNEQLFTIEAPQGTNSRISLPDSTQVWLNAGSTLSYSSEFNKSSRNITLSGEAYFEVAKNPDLPFKVHAQSCVFTVLGTKFNISAYQNDPNILAALMEGSLRFESKQKHDVMVPGDLITYDCNTGSARREQVNVEQFRAWIHGKIRYDAITLPALLRRLAREYDVEIELCTTAFDSMTFRVSLTNAENIEMIMNSLCEILPISVQRQGQHFYVNRKIE